MNSGPALAIGSTGPDVRRLQILLVMIKLLDFSGIDGTFGQKTQDAVKSFQEGSNLTPDGIVGPLTWQALPADPNTQKGVVIFLTLGTGVGSAVFNDGVLVPNTELGHMEIRGRDAERRSAAAARIRRGISWKAWAQDLDEHLQAIDRLFWPRLFIIGGGVSKQADRFIPRLTCRPPVFAAKLRNEAGIVGAALLAADQRARVEVDPEL